MAAPRNSTRGNVVAFKGVQDARGLDRVPFGAFAESENVDITDEGKPRRRSGRTKVYSGAVRDAWGDGTMAIFLTETGELRQLNTRTGDSTLLRSGVTGVGRLAAARVATTLYWSFGTHNGVIQNGLDRTAGFAQLIPAGIVPVAGASDLPAGTYRYAWASLSADGDEGPVGLRGVFTLDAAGGASLVPPIPTDARATRVRGYLTAPDGTQLYRLGTVDAPANAGEQSVRHLRCVTDLPALVPARDGSHPLPPAFAAGTHDGRMLAAYGDLLLYSARFDYEYFHPEEMFVPFSARVTIVAPVDGGVFVGTDTDMHFLDGADIASAQLEHKAGYGAVPHTLDYLEASEHDREGVQGRVAVWMGRKGPVFGLPNGGIEDAGDGVITVPGPAVYGAGAVQKHRGDTYFVSAIRYLETS